MTRHKKAPLRALTEEERIDLETLSRARTAPAEVVIRAKLVLAVAQGLDYTQAARSVGRKSNDAVSRLVARFNHDGLEALLPRSGGGGVRGQYQAVERARILREFQRAPELEQDGTGTWSLTTLQRALRQAEDGLPKVSTYTILKVLHEAGYTWQRSRTWAHTGQVIRKRKSGNVTVTDEDGQAKKRA
jgi:transposase